MKKIKIENQTVVVDTENKDIELYTLVPDGKDVWRIVNENEEIVDTITKDVIVNYCKKEFEDNDYDFEYFKEETIIDGVWLYMNYNPNLKLVDHCCQEFDKFIAWFEYICIEYFAKELIDFYKQKLLNWE